MIVIRNIKYIIHKGYELFLRGCNRLKQKNKKTIFFYPHGNCLYDDYDIFNGESSNVLCLLKNILQDKKFDDYELYVLYYHHDKLQSYLNYVHTNTKKKIHFIYCNDKKAIRNAVFQCYTIFTDSDYTRILYRIKSQRVICLNYFGGLIKNEFYRWANHGGFKKMVIEQKQMHRLYDYHLSISDICSKFIALDNCHYFPHFISLGFPRNDIFSRDNSELRKQVENLVNFKVKKIITYVPTHRDYENPEREFFDSTKATNRSIWGRVGSDELMNLEKTLADTNTLVIAKVHPVQQVKTQIISKDASKHVIYYKDLAKKIRTSLNPLLAISDAIITDYTTTVYDFLYTNRPIIYYFYDIEQYRATRGFFIEPIESICAGHLTYNLPQLCTAIKDIANGQDPYYQKRHFIQELFIKHLDGNATERIKEYFFKE
jgi:hypothetical protein